MKYIFANWKMNKSLAEAMAFSQEIKKLKFKNVIPIICSPVIYLSELSKVLTGSNVKLAAQNIAAWDNGPYTGEISARQLAPFCQYAIIGHSERKIYLNENLDLISKKINQAINNKIIPLVCLGENEAEKASGKSQAIIKEQWQIISKNINKPGPDNLMLVYEPQWAISTAKDNQGVGDTPENAQAMHQFLKGLTENKFPIIYGGSVKPENCASYIDKKEIDGALVGGASLDLASFIEILKLVENA